MRKVGDTCARGGRTTTTAVIAAERNSDRVVAGNDNVLDSLLVSVGTVLSDEAERRSLLFPSFAV